MLDITKDNQSLTTFRRRSGDFMKQLKSRKQSVILTVKGKAAAIVQDAEAYQHLLDLAARADFHEGIRQGLEEVGKGKAVTLKSSLRILKQSMAYRVEIVPRAQRDLLHLFERINARSSANAPEKTAAAWNEVGQFFDRHLSR